MGKGKRMVTCPVCYGYGAVFPQGSAGPFKALVRRPCGECGGEGVIEVEDTAEEGSPFAGYREWADVLAEKEAG